MLSVHGVLLSHILQNAAFSVDCTSTFLQCGTYYIFIIHPTNTKYGLLCTHQGVDYMYIIRIAVHKMRHLCIQC